MRTHFLILTAALALIAFDSADGQPPATQPPPAAAGGQAAASQAPPAADGQAAQATAPDAPADQISSPSESPGVVEHNKVIINAQRDQLVGQISAFVNQLTDFDLADPARGLARWHDPVCPLVSGLPQKHGEYILERVSEIAKAAGVPLAGRFCHPNLFILISNQAQSVLEDLRNRHLDLVFGDASPARIDRFIATPRPVRTWYDTVERTPEGLPLVNESFPGISDQKGSVGPGGVIIITPVRPNDPSNLTTNPWSQASHLTLNVVWAIYRVFVIVDPTKFKQVSLGQLADFVAMTGLSQIKADARLEGAPSILTLFDGPPEAASAGMTDWDRAFLKACYSTEQKLVLQRSEIARGMVASIAP